MPFKVLNSRTVIIGGEEVLPPEKAKQIISSYSKGNSNSFSLNYLYLLDLNRPWKKKSYL